MKLINKYFFLCIFSISIFLSILFYKSSLDFYFFQDDFFEINISKASMPKEYLNFFTFRDDIVAYRPISLQNYFFISQSLFGLNPIGFRLITLVLFLGSGWQIARVIGKISNNKSVGLLAASFWLTSSIHFMAVTWIAAAYNITGTFFFLLTSFLFLKYTEAGKKIFYILSLLSFAICIGSFEFSVAWVPIFFLYYFNIQKNSFAKTLRVFFPYAVLSAVYLILRLSIINVPDIAEYEIALSQNSLKALFWYFLWVFNIPEEFKKQIVNNLLQFNSKFQMEFTKLIIIAFAGAMTVILAGIVLPFAQLVRKKYFKNQKLIFLFIFWFLIAISPVLIIPNHSFVMYLTLSSIGLYALLAYLLIRTRSKLLAVLVMTTWIITSYSTLSFYKHNFWMIKAQETANIFRLNAQRQLPYLPSNSVVIYFAGGEEETQPLQQNHALRAIYNDPSLIIYYNKKALLNDLEELKGRPIFLLTHD